MKPDEKLEYYRERLKAVFEEKPKLLANFEIIDEYIMNKVSTKATNETVCNNYSVFTVFSKWCTKPIEKLTEGDMASFIRYLKNHTYERGGKEYNYSVHTIHMYRIVLAKFFSRQLKRDDLAAILFEPKPLDQEHEGRINKREKENLLTEEEVFSKMINLTNNNRDKALLSVFYECGARRGELLLCKIRHIDMKPPKGCYLTIPGGKTGKRKVLLVRSKSYLRAWIEAHPQRLDDGRPDPDAFLFISTHPKKVTDGKTKKIRCVYGAMSESAVYKQLRHIAEMAGIDKPANPHQYRHASASNLADRGWSSYQLNAYHGWSNKSSTAAGYIHGVDVDEKIYEMNDIEPEQRKKYKKKVNKTCANCKNDIEIHAAFCPFCGYSDAEQIENEMIEASEQQHMKDQMSSYVDMLMAEKMKEIEEKQKKLDEVLNMLSKGSKKLTEEEKKNLPDWD
jgi:site-specific recombinase XerD